eukprot:c20538_g1_i3 orf=51-227(+)
MYSPHQLVALISTLPYPDQLNRGQINRWTPDLHKSSTHLSFAYLLLFWKFCVITKRQT